MTKKKNYPVTAITGEHYKQLIEAAQAFCSQFLCVVRPTIELSERAASFLHQCHPYLRSKTSESVWPGTQLLDDTATIYRVDFVDKTREFLIIFAEGLADWQQPDLPEDLCFLDSTGAPWLVSITHEDYYYFELSEAERLSLQRRLPWLDLVPGSDAQYPS